MSIIVAIKENRLKLVVDHYGQILDEYKNNINRECTSKHYKKFMSEWFHMTNSKYIYAEPINNNIIRPLKNMGFHEKDLKFVRVALYSSLKKILSTDEKSFLDDVFKTWICENLDIICQDPRDFYNALY